jgi:hypothetical protein
MRHICINALLKEVMRILYSPVDTSPASTGIKRKVTAPSEFVHLVVIYFLS